MGKTTVLLLAILLCAACTARPEAQPSEAQLVGTYVLTKVPAQCRSATMARPSSEVHLAPDGSFKINGLPACFEDDNAPATELAGTIAGQWDVAHIEGEYVLELLVNSGPLTHGWNLGVKIRLRRSAK